MKFKPIYKNTDLFGFMRFSHPQVKSFGVCTDDKKEVVFKIGYKNRNYNWWVHHVCLWKVTERDDSWDYIELSNSRWGRIKAETWWYPHKPDPLVGHIADLENEYRNEKWVEV